MNQSKESGTPAPEVQKDLHIDIERPWLSRFHFLKEHGYLLRARYRPGWVPSWKDNPDVFKLEREDGVNIRVRLLDAQRISDGQFVMIKEVKSSSKEGLIACYLSSEKFKSDPRNHAVPVLDVLKDVVRSGTVLLVFPVLRHITDPPISSVSEALDLVGQTLEGLVFLHEHEVAHRDCAFGNIMMDARALFPTQWHPQFPHCDLQNRIYMRIKSRTDVGGVRYYFTDFGLSSKGEVQVTGLAGLEPSPELSDHVPYNPYKLDVYILGKMYQRKILDEFINVGFLQPLIDRMTSLNPVDYLSAVGAYAMFKDIRASLNIAWFNQRLRKRESRLVARFLKESSYWLQLQLTQLSAKPVLPPLQ
ncbi:hypothetical protein M407DRAFT_77767 [Tulasnella calospora MUT 4182]|uniref:Protein kinase domain-containing protein n=1 Tax=Tulasnella calospora MUT 4182 TaxID=1051891 RepID=A0A0C3LQK4_9AGAM|nr:hypothetical protein M407DRAFT_77767 [Tulasnella calospora MUT 4182]